MPKLRQHQTNPEWEHGYRRGYAHGVSATMEAIGDLLPEAAQAKINVWVSRELRLWEMDQSDFKPPAFPSVECADLPSGPAEGSARSRRDR